MGDLFYSARTGGFYDTDIVGSAKPDDAVKITSEEHRSLMAAQSNGAVITADKKGRPVATPRAAMTPEQMLAMGRETMTASRFQARMALRNAGLFEQAEAAVRASGDVLLIEAWDSAVEFRRLSPAILALGTALGLSAAQIDDLFREAATITA